jgi:hypothetical protein
LVILGQFWDSACGTSVWDANKETVLWRPRQWARSLETELDCALSSTGAGARDENLRLKAMALWPVARIRKGAHGAGGCRPMRNNAYSLTAGPLATPGSCIS